VPGHGPVTLTPAFPSSGSDGDIQPVGPGFHFQQANSISQVQGTQGNVNLAANANEDDSNNGYQATGSRPQVSGTNAVTVYDPFCNCYKTGPDQGPISVENANKPQLGHSNAPVLSKSDEEDEDSDD